MAPRPAGRRATAAERMTNPTPHHPPEPISPASSRGAQQSRPFSYLGLDENGVVNDRLIADGQGHPIDQTMREEVFRLVREWFGKQGVVKP